MVNFNHLPNDNAVLQAGLFTEDLNEVKTLSERIARFNHNNDTNITADFLSTEKGDAQFERPHVKIYLKFPSPEVQEKFWLE